MSGMGVVELRETDENKVKKTYERKLYKFEAYDVYISHIRGNALKPDVVEPIVNEDTIHTAIVLGTQTEKRLSSYSEDTRMMSIMLLLRRLWMAKNEGISDPVPMHVVGENQEDMSAKLALAPPVVDDDGMLGNDMHDPDFINTQAIYARVLVQTLAYPALKPAKPKDFEKVLIMIKFLNFL